MPTKHKKARQLIRKFRYQIVILILLVIPSTATPFELTPDPNYQQPLRIKKNAEQGDADAQYTLGVRYDTGEGVVQDKREAVKWYRKAAEQGYPEAQHNLGVMYSNGEGVEQDNREAVKWYRKAAEQGWAGSQYNLGIMYSTGEGVVQDTREAVKWHRKAAEQGYSQAQHNLGMMYFNGRGVDRDSGEAVKWYSKAAEQDFLLAQCMLGVMYYYGLGVDQDYDKVAKFARKPAEEGDPTAQWLLGQMYYYGQGFDKDYNEGIKWFRRSAEQGFVKAQGSLGLAYLVGEGVRKDVREAIRWNRKAAEQGDSISMLSLGNCYTYGQGVIEDYVEAYVWLLLASKYGTDLGNPTREVLKGRMTRSEVLEAQRRAKIIDQRISSGKELESTESPESKEYNSSGTGFFICPSGYLVTSHHVIEGAEKIEVLNSSGKWQAKVAFSDKANDIAILSVEGSGFNSLKVISASQIKSGTEVFTVGFPNIQLQGSEPKYTEGVVSSLSGVGNDFREFQISVPVQPGNSGGPLLNKNGRVVGLIAARLDDEVALVVSGSLPQNVNYAVKSDYFLPVIKALPEKSCAETYETPGLSAVERARKSIALVLTY